MYFETSPGSSPSRSMPISFITPQTMASPTCSLYSASSQSSTSTRASPCAYPSWPTGKSLEYRSPPSSFISDADLFGDDLDDCATPWLDEAPAPPRMPTMAQAFPILPPLFASKPKKQQHQQQQQRRRSSDRKSRRGSKPMSPISESPEVVE